MKLKFIYSFLLTFICLNINGQNLITVPFNNGFVGDNSANNNSTNAYYTAGANGVGLGWTNLQFAQNSTSNIFTAQGNDIIGSVLITDATGSEKTINGFIKWRAPSGQVTTMCFQPETGTNVTLATNGTNGTSTYIITDTKYIGLTFNGKTLSITGVPGTVSGNAATSGLLSELNAYLATFGKLSVADVSVNEGAGTATVTVTLSASSTNVITVAYTTSNGTATAGQDYTATSGTLTFTAGQTSRTFTISIINDTTVESTETINITLSDPTNASILDGAGVVSIVDNDNCSLSSPTASVTVQPTCAVPTGTIVFTTQSGVDYSIDGTTYQSSATFTGVAAGTYTLRVRSTTNTSCITTGATVTINAVPSAPSFPTASVTVQPTCAVTTGTIVFTTQSGVDYSINGTTYQSSATFTGVAPGTYTLRVRSTTDNTCITSGSSSVTVNAVPSAPSSPSASVTVQPTCAVPTGTIVFTTQSGVEYSIDGTTYQSGATFTGVAAGTYTISVRSTADNTCSTTGATVTINAVASAPSTPSASVTVQPTCAVPTGTIVFTTQSGVDYSIDGTTYQSSATFTGVAAGTYTISVRSTADNTCSTTGATVTINAVASAPSTPSASVTVQPTCAVPTGTIVFTTQSGVEYSIDGTTYQSGATFTGVAAGTYTISVRSTADNTCSTTGATVTINAVASAPSTPSASVTVQPTCAVPTGTIVFTTQSGVDYSIDGTTYQSSATFTGVAAGTYTISVRSTADNTCSTTGATVTINAVPSAPSSPSASVTVQPTCAVPTGTIVFTTQSGVDYSIDGTTYQSGATFTGVAAGTYTISVRSTADNTCSTTGATVTINAVASAPSTPSASVTVQPTCAVPTGTIVFTTQSGVEYSIDGTTYQSGATFTGVAAGTYTISVRSTADNTCSTTGATVTINAVASAPSTPSASVTVQPTCAVPTGTIVFTTQSGVDYSIDGTTYQSSATFTGVAAGTYTISVRSTADNTCSTTGATVTINAVASAPSTPSASVTVQPTCAVPTGTIVFTTQSGVDYSIDGTTYQSGATFTGVAAGTYTISVRSTADNTCSTTGATVTINAVASAPSTPSASVTVQPTCAVPTGTIVFTTQSGVEYSIDGTTYQSGATFTGVAAGTYTISVRSTADNTCSTTGATVTINAVASAPSTPSASVTVQPTCAVPTGTIVFTTQSGVEYSIDGTTYQSSATFTGVAAGTYTISVRSTADNTCSTTGATLTINAVVSAPSSPAASVTVQPTCAVPTGTIVFTTQSGVEYSIDGTTYQSSATFTGVAAGTYTISVRSTADNTCSTTGATVTINAVPSAPSSPTASVTVQPTCAVTTGTIVFTTQSGVEYSIDGTTYQSSATFTGVAAGTYTISVRSTADNTCSTTGATVTINAVASAPSTPSASVTVQPTCAVPTGTIVFTTQSGVEYSIDGTTYQSSATFTGVAAGTYTISVRSTADNTCSTTGATLTINAVVSAPSSPTASVTVQPTCAVPTGTIVFTTQSGVEYSIDDTTYQSSATFTGVAAGTYTISVRSTADNTCSTTGATLTINAVVSAPSSPTASVTVQPTCAVPTGTIVFTTQSGVEYSIDGTTYQSSATFTGVAAGTYTISVRSTADNTCSTTGATVTINAVASAPSTPSASVTVQPTCAVPTGTIVFTTQSGVEYSIDGTTYQSSATFTGVAAGTYTISVRSTADNTCSTTGATLTINAVASAPSSPTASVTVQPTCAVTTGTIVFTTQSGVEYSIDGTTYQSSATFTGVAAGTYTISVRSTADNTCSTTGATVTVNAVASAPSTPSASVTVQPTCAVPTGTIVFTTQSGVEYSIDGTTYQSSATFTGVAAGTYTISVRSTADNTCSTTGATLTINAVASAPSSPTASVTVQPTCAVTTGTIVFTTQSGVEYSIDGTTYQSSATFTGVAAGTYTISVRSTADNTCSTTGATVTVNAVASAPSTPSASVTVQPTCAVPTGTIVFTTQSGVEYSIDGTTYQSSATFTGVAAGTYTISVRSTADNTCSTTGATVTINAVASAPSTPSASVTVQPTCAVPTGTIVFTTQSGVEYSIDGTTYQSSATFTGVAAGTYTISVRSTADKTCSTTGANSVTVFNSICAVDDSYSSINGYTGSTTASVLVNDTLNGVVVNPSQIILTPVTVPSGFTLNADGTITIASGISAGTYTVTYSICEVLNPTNCDTADVFITVVAAPIVAVDDSYSSINGYTGSTTASVLVNDTLNGVVVNPSQIILTPVTVPSGFTLNADGTITIASGISAGTYTVTYSICEVLNPTNCDTADVVITVVAAPIVAVDDSYSSINGYTGSTTSSVLVNDTLNGVVVNPSQIILTPVTVPSGFTLNADGTITIASGISAGTYTVTYSICEVLNPTNCDTADVVITVVAAPIVAVDDSYSSINGYTGSTTASVLVNDTLNGVVVNPSQIILTPVTVPSGFTLNADGTITIASGISAGTYTVTYSICEVLNPTNCDTADVFITVVAAPIVAVDDSYSSINGYTGSTTASVLVNDTLNGVVVNPSQIILTPVTVPSGFTLNADGTITIASGISAGTYTVTYSICEVLNPTNCDTADVVITVVAAPIVAVDDSYSSINGYTGSTTASVLVNDTLNGVVVNPSQIILTPVTVPSGFTLNADGTITIASGISAGTYTVTYSICEVLNPTNCDTADVVITVVAAPIVAVDDSYSSINGYTGSTTSSVLVNDTLNGVVVNPSQIILTPVTVPSGFTLNADGTITIASGISAGTYTVTYSICEVLNPTNCDTADVVITVVAAPIVAVDDSYSSINGYTGSTTASVLVNDTLNGVVVNPSQIILTPVTVPSGFTLNADGTITIASGISAGTYTVTYSICEVLNPTNCDTADVFITVVAAPIVAVDDSYSSINGYTGSTTASVLVNDTLNGVVVNPSQIILTPVTVPSGFTLNADGTITIASGISAGTYTVTYSICEVLNPTNCDTADVVITVVAAPIVAVDDSYSSINGYTGSTTSSVLVNDTLNGVVVNPSQIILTPVTVPSGFTLNADGTITIASGISAGTYTVTYSICEVLNPTNCDTADVVITVVAAPIVAVDDSYSSINGYTGSTTASVLVNDTLNGVVVNPSQIILTPVTVPSGFTLNADGTITIASGISAGTYTVTYSICEVLNPTNCDTADVFITVVAAPIVAVDDSYSSINGYTGSTTASVLVNDTLNGVVVNPSQIILTPVTVPSGFTLNADGTITIASGISAGTYTVTYSICEVLNPTNCDTADVVITVVAAPIVAVDDSYSSINGYTGSTTASVLVNDTLNGVVVNPSQIILTPVTVPSGFTLNADGTITIASGISAGTYTVTYSICEVLNPTNCDTADVVITVVAAPIVAVDDSYSSINGYTGSTTSSVLVNDTLNGVVVNPSQIILTPVTVPSGFTLNADGTITIASGISAGTYTVTYSICEVLNPTNCDTADVVITVVAAPIVAVDDSYSSINGYTGSTTASVLVNDTLNGVVVNPSQIILTPVTVPSGFTLNADGTITIASGISAGTYTVTYSICEVLNPTNCDTADVVITVVAAPIVAVDDSYSSINGYTGSTTASVLVNDTLNGVVVNPSQIILTPVTVPSGFTLNADGTITIASGISAGTYTVTYSICEVLNPTNCDTADVVITVVAAPIVAVDDSYSSINGYTGSTTSSVLVNDTLNGVVVNPSQIILTPVTVPSGFTLNADGTITIASGISAGTYTVTYSICEVLNPTNCDTADVVITVVAAPIVAVDDSYSSINGYTGSTTSSVLVNDTLNGVVVNPSQIILTPVTVPSGFTLNADGTITIASGISAGTYTVTYSICEVLNPTNCDTADVVITVVAAPIVAVDDSYSSINGYTGSTTASVLVNDTLNGVVVNPSQIILTPVTVPSGFTLNADGTITIASGISAGTYTVTYSICEVLNPTNCDTADVVITVVAAPIVAVDDSYSSINGYTGSTTSSVLVNDTLNGVVVNPSQIILTPVTVPSGFTLNADGTITIASGISAGTYTVTYSICEVLNPTNCDTADVVITVVAAPIVAVDDSYSSINGYTGSTTASVLVNDTLNGVVVNPSQIILTPVTVPSGFTLNADGTITIASGISAGTYTVTYSICEVLNPTNCDTADVVITVVAAPIVAVDDSYSSINGYTGSTTSSVLVNDTLNGVVVNPSQIILTPVTVPSGFTLNADGTITIASGISAGTYTVTYSICEVLNPTNCDTADVVITVVAAPIVAVDDSYSSINGYTGSTTASVLVNDTLNGVVVNPSQIILTPVTVPSGFTLNADGTITIASGISAGTYTVTYSICEVLNPTNCDTADVVITVVAAPIVAVDDSYSSINGYTGSTTASVLVNDTLNGVVVNPSQIILTPVTVPSGFTLNADGTITIASGISAGTYTVTYSICEVLNPTNCDTADVFITVVAAPIVAVDDSYSSINGYTGSTTASVLVNDTLNGVVVNPSQIILTPVTVPSGFTLNADGTITIASGISAGTYTVTYSICEVLNPTNCDTADVVITVVAAPIVAVDDSYSSINGYTGSTTSSVLVNDTLNGVVVNPSQIILTPVTVPSGFTLNADGTITIASGISAGTYTVTYSICEVLNPTNCDTADVVITVVAAPIVAVDDSYSSINGYTGSTTASVLVNDTLNGVVVNPSQIILTPVTVPSGFTLNADGTITIASGISAGTYTVTYSICEVLNPTNCDTADVFITVVAAPIVAVDDSYSSINGYTGSTTASVLVNDTLNGVVVNPSQIILTPVTVPSGFTLNADGTITIASGISAGTYTVTYSICEVLNPTNCDTADVVITVVAAPIVAVDDNYTSSLFNGVAGGVVGDLTLNDTLNGASVLDSLITITLLNTGGISGLSIDANGNLFIPSGTPSGSYIIEYQICEILNSTNCDVATVSIIIGSCLDFLINDCDGDGVTNGQEIIDGTDPSNSCDLTVSNQDASPNLAWLQGDCDGDGVSNGQEVIDGTDPINPCDYLLNHVVLPQGGLWLAADCDGDGVTNGQEIIDGTNLSDPCESIEENVSLPQSQEFLAGDCDGDGLNNGEEIGNNPNNPNDSNGNGIPDYLEINNHSVSQDDLEIFNLVTPNADGDNDIFVIRNIELYPNNSVEIYNRWGVKVFETKGYGQNGQFFRGISEGRVTINQDSELPIGTYFYIVKYVNDQGTNKERSGYLYLNR